MKNGLVKAAGTILILSAIGCASTPNRQFPKGMITGINYGTLDQSRVPYGLEEHVMYGERQFFYEREQTPETLPFKIIDNKDTTRVLDLDSQTMELRSDNEYIPVQVTTKKGIKDKFADGVGLRTDGPYGIKAHMLCDNQLRQLAENPNNFGYRVMTTEDGASFMLRTINILGEEYFFPMVETEEMNKKWMKNYYLIPVKGGAEIRIDYKDGTISLYNENKVYRPVNLKKFYKSYLMKNGLQSKDVKPNF